MARSSRHDALAVFLNSRFVGRLDRQAGGAIGFRYDRDFLNWEHALPLSLSLPLRDDAYSGAPVIAVFDNLLPDSDAIRRRVAARMHAHGTDAYSLLAAIGRDCVGALQFLPDGADPGPAGMVAGQPLADNDIAALIGDLAATPLGLDAESDFRISIAGAQEKTALLRWNGQWHKPSGSTATTHILKPQIGRLPNGLDLSNSVENEFLCLKLCAAMGLPSANAEMVDFDDRRVLVVERFDRRWTPDGRLLRRPQEDLCQALSVPPTLKYEADGGPGLSAILDLLKASDDPDADRARFLKAVIVFWLLGATDGHAKNFSLHLAPGGRFRMAPLYDVISAQPSLDAGQVRRNRMKLAMAAGTNRHFQVDAVMPRHFAQSAASVGMQPKTVTTIMDDLLAIVPAALEDVASAVSPDLPEVLVASVRKGVMTRLNRIASFRAG